MNTKTKKYFVLITLILIASVVSSCVESLSDTQTSTTPTIEILYPLSGDTVMVGKNYISFKAADGSGGSGLSHYELFINGIYVQKFTQNTDGTNPLIYLTIDSTLIGKRINYYLIVYNSSGKLKVSKVQENLYVKDKPPKAPGNLVGTFTATSTVTLLWDDSSSNEKGFEVWRKDINSSGTIDYRRIKTLSENTISTTDIGLSSITAYYYVVRAFNTSGYSNFSNEVSPQNSTGGPWSLKAEGIGSNTIHLTWTDFAPNELGFIIERIDSYTSQFKQLQIVAANTTEYTDTQQITAGGTYTYRIAYFTSTSKSQYSNEATASTSTLNLSAPILIASLNSANSVKLTWTYENTQGSSYETEIERRAIGSIGFTKLGTKAAGVTEYIDSSVASGITYEYRVRQILSATGNTYTPYSKSATISIP